MIVAFPTALASPRRVGGTLLLAGLLRAALASAQTSAPASAPAKAPAQTSAAAVATPLPAGFRFSTQTPGNGSAQPAPLRYDFDGDGTPDAVAVVEASRPDPADADAAQPRLMVWLSRRAGQPPLTHPPTDALNCCESFTRRGSLLLVHSTGMRYFEAYTFRYDAGRRDLRLIGIDSEAFGNADHDGAGTTSYNLLTGRYTTNLATYNARTKRLQARPTERRVVPPKAYYLSSLDQGLAFWERLSAERL